MAQGRIPWVGPRRGAPGLVPAPGHFCPNGRALLSQLQRSNRRRLGRALLLSRPPSGRRTPAGRPAGGGMGRKSPAKRFAGAESGGNRPQNVPRASGRPRRRPRRGGLAAPVGRPAGGVGGENRPQKLLVAAGRQGGTRGAARGRRDGRAAPVGRPAWALACPRSVPRVAGGARPSTLSGPSAATCRRPPHVRCIRPLAVWPALRPTVRCMGSLDVRPLAAWNSMQRAAGRGKRPYSERADAPSGRASRRKPEAGSARTPPSLRT